MALGWNLKNDFSIVTLLTGKWEQMFKVVLAFPEADLITSSGWMEGLMNTFSEQTFPYWPWQFTGDNTTPLPLQFVHCVENSLAMAKTVVLSVSVLCALHSMLTAVIFIVVPVPDYRVLKYMGMWSNQGIFEHILSLRRIWSCFIPTK